MKLEQVSACVLRSRLRPLMKARGINYKVLGEKSGIPVKTLYGWSAGNSPRHLADVYAVAKVLGVSLEELCFSRADELEEMIVKHLVTGLSDAGYFAGLGERVKKSAKASNSTFTSEEKRAREVLYDLEKRISLAWQIQLRGKLTQEALQVISDDLNKLAQEKKTLKDYLDGLTEMRVDQEDVEARSELLFERLEEFEKGWAKAPQSLQKILLKRVIRNVLTQADGIKILYRLRDGIDEKRNQGLALGNQVLPT